MRGVAFQERHCTWPFHCRPPYSRNTSCTGAASPTGGPAIASDECTAADLQQSSFQSLVEQASRPLHSLTPQKTASASSLSGMVPALNASASMGRGSMTGQQQPQQQQPSSGLLLPASTSMARDSAAGCSGAAAQVPAAAASSIRESAVPVIPLTAPSQSTLDPELVGELLSVNYTQNSNANVEPPPAPPAAPAPPPSAPPPPARHFSASPTQHRSSAEVHRAPNAKESETAPLLRPAGSPTPSPLLQMPSHRVSARVAS